MCFVERLYMPMDTLTIGASNESRTIGLNHENFSKDIELMQYVGLKDKNGKEIYEGDVIQELRYKGCSKCGDGRTVYNEEIVFYGGCFCLKPEYGCPRDLFSQGIREYSKYGDNYYEENDKCEKLEVIGNIYENPELLKGTND